MRVHDELCNTVKKLNYKKVRLNVVKYGLIKSSKLECN